MSEQRSVYRKAALDKLASPEELDRLMQITGPGSWLLLVAFGGVMVMAVLWGIFGTITTALDQTGLLTLSNPVIFVPAPEAGQVAAIDVEPGDRIAAGQTIAEVTTQAGSVSVASEVSGRVTVIRAAIGEPVDAGTPLISVESFDRDVPQLEVIAYLPLTDRQRVRPGMAVQALPSTVEREKYGYLEGTIQSVAQFAATREEMLVALGDSGYVDDLASQGPVFEVRIALKNTSDGSFTWSASDGPATPLVSGTPCLLHIIIDKKRPISKLLNLS